MKTLFKSYFGIPYLNLFNVIMASSIAWNHKSIPTVSMIGCAFLIALLNILSVNKFRTQ